jgi:GWxTD domain-containing protein
MTTQRLVLCVLLLIVVPSFGGVEVERDSLSSLKRQAKVNPKDRDLLLRLGQAYLDAGNGKKAREAFRKAAKGRQAADAYNGLGLAQSLLSKGSQRKAFEYFRRALGANPVHLEARMNIARLHQSMGDMETERALQDVIDHHPKYAPAYLLLAEWYSDTGYEDRMTPLYHKYMSLRPEDLDGHYGLVVVYAEQRRYGAVLDIVEVLLEDHPDDIRFLPVAGQAFAARGQSSNALVRFESYLRKTSDEKRGWYEDISLIAFPEELEAYRALPDGERGAFLELFWRRRDPTLVSSGETRRAEHYRRVWYAMTFLSKNIKPWDRRGEVYIRYGEPDYRSRSDRVNPPPNMAVEAVKERQAAMIYTDKWKDLTDVPPEVGSGRPLVEPIFPIDRDLNLDQQQPHGFTSNMVARDRQLNPQQQGASRVPWESWIYTTVGDGVEFVFTDQMLNGRWEFAPMPRNIPSKLTMQVNSFAPAAVLARAIVKEPDRYTLPPGLRPLEFYYDTASFRRTHQVSNLELYLGIPLDQVESNMIGEQNLCRVEWRVALLDTAGEAVHRGLDEVVFVGQENPEPGMFAPELVPMRVPPGDYRLAVQLTDIHSGRWGVYHQDINVPAYEDSLGMSDLELAWGITEAPQHKKFRKGDVWVIPMPSRSYRAKRPIHVYYEVYHFRKDEFGQTKYRVSYKVKQDLRRGFNVLGSLASGFRKLLGTGKETVSVSYEREGRESWERIFLEIDTEKVGSGIHQIEVKVTDLLADRTETRRAMFRLE